MVAAEGGVATAVTADVADPAGVEAMVAAAAEHLGGLDGVVYNVGIGARAGLERATPEAWDRVFAVNVRGAMLTARAALPVSSTGASLVFISSVAGHQAG